MVGRKQKALRRHAAEFSAPRSLARRLSRATPSGCKQPPYQTGTFLHAEVSAIPCVYAFKQPLPLPPLHTHPATTTKPDYRRRASTEGGQRRGTRRSARAATAAGTRARASGRGGGGLERKNVFEREMLLMAAPGDAEQQLKRRRGRPLAADLLQNCDLPPPAKLFGPFPTLQRLENAAGADQKGYGAGAGGNDSLLRALRLSQSRAREAEEKLAAAGASNGDLAALLVRDSVALSAHRRWVMMLEAENSALRAGGSTEPEEEEDGQRGMATWWVALALCVGIAGVGLALGKLLL